MSSVNPHFPFSLCVGVSRGRRRRPGDGGVRWGHAIGEARAAWSGGR